MSRYEAMLSYAPLYYQDSDIYKAILASEGLEFDLLRQDIEDLRAQFFIDTATWGLEFWEKEYGLRVSPELSYEERRSRIKGKKRGIGKVDGNIVEQVAGAFNNNYASAGFDGRIIVDLTRKQSCPQLMLDDVQNAVEQVIPAHLDYRPGLRYEGDAHIYAQYLPVVEADLYFCGTYKCGAFPEANAVRDYEAAASVFSAYWTCEKIYKVCGQTICGRDII